MTEKIEITVRGSQSTLEGKNEEIVTKNIGTYDFHSGVHILKYEETVTEDGDVVKNILKIYKNQVEVIKSGAVGSTMVFTDNSLSTTDYVTPYGSFKLGIKTGEISLRYEEDLLFVSVPYILQMGEDEIADCNIKIEARNI